MKKILLLILVFALIPLISLNSKEINLKPFIGVSSLPADGDSICPIGFVTDQSLESYGYRNGDTIPDFTLYNINGEVVNIKTELLKGKPVLLIAGSYTCPVFRALLPSINQLETDFHDFVSIFIIYVVEPHPNIDVSPYSAPPGKNWLTNENIKENILYRQPRTYLERKNIYNDMMKRLTILPKILLDGTCNNWWTHFGPAPVNGYLVDTEGIIASKQTWLNMDGNSMTRDIKILLSKTIDFDSTTVFNIQNNVEKLTGKAGDTLKFITKLINTKDKDVFIDLKPVEQNLPLAWSLTYFSDGGSPWDLDTLTVYLAPNQSKDLRIFLRVREADSGDFKFEFKNSFNPGNKFYVQYSAVADEIEGDVDNQQLTVNSFELYPNPADENLTVVIDNKNPENKIEILNLLGEKMKEFHSSELKIIVNIETLQTGIYFLILKSGGYTETKKFVKY